MLAVREVSGRLVSVTVVSSDSAATTVARPNETVTYDPFFRGNPIGFMKDGCMVVTRYLHIARHAYATAIAPPPNIYSVKKPGSAPDPRDGGFIRQHHFFCARGCYFET